VLRGQQSSAGIGISHMDDLLAEKIRPGMHISLRFVLMLLQHHVAGIRCCDEKKSHKVNL